MFVENEFYFSKASEFNDPFDCNVHLSFSGNENDYRKLLEDLVPLLYKGQGLSDEQLEDAIERNLNESLSDIPTFEKQLKDGAIYEIRNKHGILCLSEKSDSTLMFSHYADGHRGFCLEFSNTGIFGKAKKVEYTEDFPTPNYFEHHLDELTEIVLLTKAKEWSYEEEWRILRRDITPGVHRFDQPDFLTGVIFGLSMLQEHKYKIRNWVAEGRHQVQFYQAEMKPNAFALNIVPVS